MFVFALTVQDGLHASALAGGLPILPMAVLFLLGSVVSPTLIDRFGRGALAAGGLAQAAGLALLIVILASGWPHVSLVELGGPLLLIGGGQSMLFTGLFRAVLSDVPAHHAGIGGGVLITLQQSGLALGVATLGTLYLALEPHSMPEAFGSAVGIQLAILLLLVLSSRLLPPSPGTLRTLPRSKAKPTVRCTGSSSNRSARLARWRTAPACQHGTARDDQAGPPGVCRDPQAG